jgi:hypothetical protein
MYNKNDSIDHANANSQMQKFYRMLDVLETIKLDSLGSLRRRWLVGCGGWPCYL